MRFAALALVLLGGCTSPEAERVRGGGPGADVGNRGDPVVMHAGSQPYAKTPKLIPAEAAPIEPARQAQRLAERKGDAAAGH
ncbi:MAG TPA: hypothetical protein VFC18_22265 [Burkholderiales bacterium]|nr:hypothetical protein [Burkholderiales bacterium]